MTELASLIRPFQSPDYAPPKLVAGTGDASSATVSIVAGQGGKVKTLRASFSETVTFYMQKRPNETARTTHVKRIHNPHDDSQYVDVEYIDTITFKDFNDYAQETKFTLNNNPPP